LAAAYKLRSSPGLVVPLAIVGSLIVAPYLHGSDLCLLAAAAWMVWEERPATSWRVPLAIGWVLASPYLYLKGFSPELKLWPWIETFHSFCARLLREHAPDRERLLLNGFQEWIVMRTVLAGPDAGPGAGLDAELLGSLDRVRRSEAFGHDVLAFVALMKQNLVHPAALLLA